MYVTHKITLSFHGLTLMNCFWQLGVLGGVGFGNGEAL